MKIQLQPQWNSLEQWRGLALQEQFGFEVSDLFSGPALADPDTAAGKVREYRDTGLVRSLHGAFIDVNPASGDPVLRELSRQRCRRSCEAAAAMGAVNVVLHSSAFPFLRGAYLQNWADECARFYSSLARQTGCCILIENAQDLDPEPLCVLMDRIDSDRVAVCLDIGHANYSRAPLEQWFSALGQRIGYIHLSDNMGAFDDHLPLGMGTIDWAAADAQVTGLGRSVPVTLETGCLEDTCASIRFLRQHHYFGMR